MGKSREQLFLKLRPGASGDHCHFNDAQEIMEQRRAFGIEGRFTLREGSVEVKNDELLHFSPKWKYRRRIVSVRLCSDTPRKRTSQTISRLLPAATVAVGYAAPTPGLRSERKWKLRQT